MWAIVGFIALGTWGTVLVFSFSLAAFWAYKSGVFRGFRASTRDSAARYSRTQHS
jgi:hypothetical protein